MSWNEPSLYFFRTFINPYCINDLRFFIYASISIASIISFLPEM